MKNLFIGFITILTIICIVNQCAFSTDNEPKKPAGYISLNSTKTKEVEPNTATITFAVENTSSVAQNAAKENNEISNKIINALKLVTSSQTDVIKTTNFSIRPIYSHTPSGKSVIKNYTAVNSIKVETKDIKKIAKLIDTAISNGANRTDNLYYGYENDKSVCNEMYPAVVKELKAQAGILAQSAGTSLDGVKQINASCNIDSIASNGRFYASKAMNSFDSAAEEAAAPAIEAGKVKVKVYVNADFYVK